MPMPSQNKSKSKQDYRTPPEFLSAVENRWGMLEADLACTKANSVARDARVEGDHRPWPRVGNLWLNPPFADIATWAAKCSLWSPQGGARLFLLTPASIGANWFADYVHGKAMVYGLSPRLKFVGEKDPYPKDLILSVFGDGPGFDVWNWTPREMRRRGALS